MNSISISGNLGKDCEELELEDGTPLTKFSVADSLGRDKPSIWWNCSIFGKRGEALSPYLLKGQTVTVIGSVTEREWVDKDGQKRKSMDVRVNDVALQGGKRESAPSPRPAQNNAPRAPAKPTASGFDDMEDVPF